MKRILTVLAAAVVSVAAGAGAWAWSCLDMRSIMRQPSAAALEA